MSEEELTFAGLGSESTLAVGKKASLILGVNCLIVDDKGLANKGRRDCCRSCFSSPQTRLSIPYFNVVWAEISHELFVTVTYAEQTSGDNISVASISYPVDQEQKSKAEIWVEELLSLSYGEAQRKKRIKVLINPYGGKGQARKIYSQKVAPIFAAAQCEIDVDTTTHQGHAVEIAERIDIDAYDVIAPCSGDGSVYEVFNGLGKRANASEALAKIAVAHIPCGSGNAMSWNLNGTGTASMAALSIVKGLRTPLDLVSVTQGSKRTLSFLSQSFGVVAETDLGTDHLRWMGAARFTYGFLVRLIGKTVYPCDLAVKVEIDGKEQIKDHYRAESVKRPSTPEREESSPSGGLPPLKYGTVNDPLPDDWKLISHDTLGNFYAGNMAYMSADANFFPASLPNDGMMDLVMIRGDIARLTAVKMLLAVENHTFFDIPEVNIRKISGYRIIPRERKDGFISIDGEKVPFEPFQTEVHKGLGTVISKSGYKYEARGVV